MNHKSLSHVLSASLVLVFLWVPLPQAAEKIDYDKIYRSTQLTESEVDAICIFTRSPVNTVQRNKDNRKEAPVAKFSAALLKYVGIDWKADNHFDHYVELIRRYYHDIWCTSDNSYNHSGPLLEVAIQHGSDVPFAWLVLQKQESITVDLDHPNAADFSDQLFGKGDPYRTFTTLGIKGALIGDDSQVLPEFNCFETYIINSKAVEKSALDVALEVKEKFSKDSNALADRMMKYAGYLENRGFKRRSEMSSADKCRR